MEEKSSYYTYSIYYIYCTYDTYLNLQLAVKKLKVQSKYRNHPTFPVEYNYILTIFIHYKMKNQTKKPTKTKIIRLIRTAYTHGLHELSKREFEKWLREELK